MNLLTVQDEDHKELAPSPEGDQAANKHARILRLIGGNPRTGWILEAAAEYSKAFREDRILPEEVSRILDFVATDSTKDRSFNQRLIFSAASLIRNCQALLIAANRATGEGILRDQWSQAQESLGISKEDPYGYKKWVAEQDPLE